MPTPDPSASSTNPASPPPEGFSTDQLRHVAKLARLEIGDEQLPRFAGQLGGILAYVKRIGEVSVEGVEPMAHPIPLQNVFREDVPGSALGVDRVLQNAPATDGPFFAVPKVIGGDDAE